MLVLGAGGGVGNSLLAERCPAYQRSSHRCALMRTYQSALRDCWTADFLTA